MQRYKGIISGEDVPGIMAEGCQDLGCDHKGDGLVMGQQCHPGAGVIAVLFDVGHPKNPLDRPLVGIFCHECNEPVTGVLIGFEDEATT